MDRFDDRLHDLHGALREQTRVFVAASVGTMLTLSIVPSGPPTSSEPGPRFSDGPQGKEPSKHKKRRA